MMLRNRNRMGPVPRYCATSLELDTEYPLPQAVFMPASCLRLPRAKSTLKETLEAFQMQHGRATERPETPSSCGRSSAIIKKRAFLCAASSL